MANRNGHDSGLCSLAALQIPDIQVVRGAFALGDQPVGTLALVTGQAVQAGRQARGRVEVRRLLVSDEPAGYGDWPHPAHVCSVEDIVHRNGKIRRGLAYVVTSLDAGKAGPDRLLKL